MVNSAHAAGLIVPFRPRESAPLAGELVAGGEGAAPPALARGGGWVWRAAPSTGSGAGPGGVTRRPCEDSVWWAAPLLVSGRRGGLGAGEVGSIPAGAGSCGAVVCGGAS